MGMIAFYAGLVIGILTGCLLLSLFAFYLKGNDIESVSEKAEGYPRKTS